MTPKDYLNLVVEPNFAAFAKDQGDARLAYNAVHSIDALAAHVFYWCHTHATQEVAGLRDDDAYRREVKKDRANLALLHDMAKALKHVELNRNSRVMTAQEVAPRPFG